MHAAPLPSSPTESSLRSSRRKTRRNAYALRVIGNRMRTHQLYDGDVIIIRWCQRNGKIQSACVQYRQQRIPLGDLTISRHGVHLVPRAPHIPTIYLENRDIQVLSLTMGIEQA